MMTFQILFERVRWLPCLKRLLQLGELSYSALCCISFQNSPPFLYTIHAVERNLDENMTCPFFIHKSKTGRKPFAAMHQKPEGSGPYSPSKKSLEAQCLITGTVFAHLQYSLLSKNRLCPFAFLQLAGRKQIMTMLFHAATN